MEAGSTHFSSMNEVITEADNNEDFEETNDATSPPASMMASMIIEGLNEPVLSPNDLSVSLVDAINTNILDPEQNPAAPEPQKEEDVDLSQVSRSWANLMHRSSASPLAEFPCGCANRTFFNSSSPPSPPMANSNVGEFMRIQRHEGFSIEAGRHSGRVHGIEVLNIIHECDIVMIDDFEGEVDGS